MVLKAAWTAYRKPRATSLSVNRNRSYSACRPSVWHGTADKNNIFANLRHGFGVVGPYGPAVADGFWVMMAPLPPGEHTIRFRAVTSDFETESIHHLTILPQGGTIQATATDGTEPTTWGLLKLLYK